MIRPAPLGLALLGLALLLFAGLAPARAAVVESVVKADHLRGLLFRPGDAQAPLPGVIVLGGSEGGLNASVTAEARALAAEGFVTLQLGYFGAAGLPATLQLIPVEYFIRAASWLQKQPGVDPQPIGIMGTSVGGEAALLIASLDPAIGAVVAAVPSDEVWQGIAVQGDRRPTSSFSQRGRALPDLPYPVAETDEVFDRYASGFAARGAYPHARIPILKIKGPVMLVCGGRDVVWPSCPMSREAVVRFRAGGFRYPVLLMAYPRAGHAVFGPPLAPNAPDYPDLGALGGTAASNDAARRENWPRAVAFLRQALATPARGF